MDKKLIKSINDSTREYAVSGYYNTLFKNYIETAGKTDGLSKYNISTLREVKEYIENCHVLIIKLLILAKILIKMYPNDSFLRGKCVHDLYMLTHSLGSQCKLYDVLGTKLKMCKVSDIELQKAINYNLKKVNERLSNVEKTSFDGYVELTSLLYYDNYLNKIGVSLSEDILNFFSDVSFVDNSIDIIIDRYLLYIDNIIVTNNLNNGKALENYKIYISRYNGIKEDYDSFKNKKKLEEQRQLKEIAELRLSDYVSKFVYSFRSLNSNKFLTVSESVILRKRLENFSFTVNNKCAYIILGVKKEKDLFVFRYVSMTSNLTADIAKMKLFSDEDEANKICSKLNERKGVACRVINIFD